MTLLKNARGGILNGKAITRLLARKSLVLLVYKNNATNDVYLGIRI